jgi:hypothetical protein
MNSRQKIGTSREQAANELEAEDWNVKWGDCSRVWTVLGTNP